MVDEILRKIEYVKVDGLFGSLNHYIPLHSAGVSIIHGPNGCGKTTVLRLMSSLIHWEFRTLKSTPFKVFELGLSGKRAVRLSKRDVITENATDNIQSKTNFAKIPSSEELFSGVDDDESMCLELFEGGRRLKSETLKSSSPENFYEKLLLDSSIIKKWRPTLRQVAPRAWRDTETDVRYSTLEIAQILHDHMVTIPVWFVEALQGIEVGFINAQRLLDVSRQHGNTKGEEKPSVRQFVEIYSEDIKLRINEALNTSAVISQRRERSFPERMLNKQYGGAVKNAAIISEYAKLQDRFSKLAETGLQEEIPLIKLQSTKLNPTERRVLALYLEDLNEKLNVFSELQDQIDAFKRIVGKKFRRKSLTIDRNLGFAIKDDQGKPLSPSTLSSGEQHQIVMFYDLVFSKKSALLFLIDEPEISLHVEWQRQFLVDLEKISKLKGHQFLIATHSPQVIGARRDIAVPLDGGVIIESTLSKSGDAQKTNEISG
ncbi:AAA family ATPase [Hydrogenophaga sp.]|uniref:AAA family ATPase n=1 Tax=Hydrogenophaga sp. TaxID=1904254 RepID=UPI0027314364|nr:AAA family ATPase [Hydrogenophaga sp.]MDP2018920.1 AAA family ATPase [Hydrogenophaga sp.]MDP3167074.1 AAA family ATPase [Hydrogenophaga sp.]